VNRLFPLFVFALLALFSADLSAAPNLSLKAMTVTTNPDGSQEYTVTLQILLLMTALTLLPGVIMLMTSFTRIIVVLAILRQAMGLQQTPSNQILLALALFMTLFIMRPVLNQVYDEAVTPYMEEQITLQQAFSTARVPMQAFMLSQTRVKDLNTFMDISGQQALADDEPVPLSILVPAFVTSELKTAFQIGFMLFIPFLVIDLVVASVLMAMGMMMLSPMIVSLPFKLMLFVLVDGWNLVMGTLATSFGL